jgi:hypothetical protein
MRPSLLFQTHGRTVSSPLGSQQSAPFFQKREKHVRITSTAHGGHLAAPLELHALERDKIHKDQAIDECDQSKKKEQRAG